MAGIYDFYAEQVIFLTGATGGLGGCLLYKLAVVLEVPRIYVLIRGSARRAVQRWKDIMPDQFEQLEDRRRTGQIVLVVGDVTEKRFGINRDVLQEMMRCVTSIIHSAANISFRAPLSKVVIDNCLPALELADMTTEFSKLRHFVQVSSAFANSFLPDGHVEEKLYYFSNPDDAEGELKEILRTGMTRYLQGFPWDYAYSKQLMERLLMARFPNLPLLLLRPTSIGPAIAQPYEMYGPQGSCPVSTLYSRLMRPTGGKSIWHTPTNEMDGNNVLDEIPVDLVANILLQHVFVGTRGVVHASASCYIPKTLKWTLEQPSKYVPAEWAAKMATQVFVDDHTVEQCKEAQFYQIGSRHWEFEAITSNNLESLQGPLTFGMDNHNIEHFTERRIGMIFQNFMAKEILVKQGVEVSQQPRTLERL
jgi:fatty acyl-CoA reductase